MIHFRLDKNGGDGYLGFINVLDAIHGWLTVCEVDDLLNYLKKLNYHFYNEDLKPVSNIKSISLKLTNRSMNFFLIHDSFKKAL